jgi:anti-sigma regulatory factor (Ser/Thr protein kinase)
MDPQRAYALTEQSEIGAVRRAAIEFARELGMDETAQGKVALVVNELATNVIKHAKRGELILRAVDRLGRVGVELLSLDEGPGISDLGRALADGYSTAGSPGNGLGAIRRLASTFDLHSIVGVGTVAVARLWLGPPPAPGPYQVGVVSLPTIGETECGDGWAIAGDDERIVVLVVDGLGHGPLAATAAREAEKIFRAQSALSAPDLLERIHSGLGHSRGAAAAVAEILRPAGVVKYAGIGNISASLHGRAGSRSMVSQSGIVGSDVRRIQLFSYPFTPEMLLVAHSDGLSAHWQLDPVLTAHDPSVIAGVLYRVAKRGRDDATVVVVRAGEGRA